MKSYNFLFKVILILIVLNCSVYFIVYSEYKKNSDLFELYDVNIMNNETLVLCHNGSYEKVGDRDIIVCGHVKSSIVKTNIYKK